MEDKDMSYEAIRARAAKNPGQGHLAPLTALPKMTRGDSRKWRRKIEAQKRQGKLDRDAIPEDETLKIAKKLAEERDEKIKG